MSRPLARSSVVVGAVWVTLAIASGLYFSFPVFFVALVEEFGWSRGATAAAFSISSVVQGVLSPPIGMLVDRLGPRRVMLYGAWVLGVACMLSSLIGSLWSLYIVVGVLAAAGACAVSWVPTGALIARWFAEKQEDFPPLFVRAFEKLSGSDPVKERLPMREIKSNANRVCILRLSPDAIRANQSGSMLPHIQCSHLKRLPVQQKCYSGKRAHESRPRGGDLVSKSLCRLVS